MCNGLNCELKENCYRYKAEPSKYRQCWFMVSPNNGLECDYFWEIKTDKEEAKYRAKILMNLKKK